MFAVLVTALDENVLAVNCIDDFFIFSKIRYASGSSLLAAPVDVAVELGRLAGVGNRSSRRSR